MLTLRSLAWTCVYAIGASLVSVIATSSGAAAASVKEGYSNLRVGHVPRGGHDRWRCRWSIPCGLAESVMDRGDIRRRAALRHAVMIGVLAGATAGAAVLARSRPERLRTIFGVVITGLAIQMNRQRPECFTESRERFGGVSTIVSGAADVDARSVIMFGLLVLIATPILRVVFSVVTFLIERSTWRSPCSCSPCGFSVSLVRTVEAAASVPRPREVYGYHLCNARVRGR